MKKGIIRGARGQAATIALFGLVAVGIIVLILVGILGNMLSVSSSISKLQDNGYIVLAAGEYDSLLALMQSIDTKADAAVVNAEAAANTSLEILDKLLLFNENEMFLFPDSTLVNVTLTAGTPADNFSAWAEITDNNSVTFTSKFAATAGYIREITLYEYSAANKLSVLEIGYGQNIGAVTIIGRCLVRSDWTYVLSVFSKQIPSGEKVYYRLKSEQSGLTLQANFKYLYVI